MDLSASTLPYYYYLKDHQGNNRVVVSSSGTVAEVNHYYPFGGVFASSGNVQPYKYNGKELDTKKGLNWYDYGARHYDAALGRWFVVDPLAEKMSAWSPYAYCFNNPIGLIDEEGKAPLKVLKAVWNVGKRAYKTYKKSGNLNLKQAFKDEALNIVDNVNTLLDGDASTFDKVIAGVDLLTGFGGEVSDGAKMMGIVDDVSESKNKTDKLRKSATIGQEAHRQIEKSLVDDYGASSEVTIKLGEQSIRKDAVMPDGKLIIIKPDTPSGHKSAKKREQLLKKSGYDNIGTIFYDPKDPKYLPGSSTYIGPKSR